MSIGSYPIASAPVGASSGTSSELSPYVSATFPLSFGVRSSVQRTFGLAFAVENAASTIVQRTFALAFSVAAPLLSAVQRTFPLSFSVDAARTKVQRTFALAFAIEPAAPSGPSDFVPSAIRTIKARAGNQASQGDTGFWSMSNPSLPTGVIDPESVIDVTMDWSAVLADISSEIAVADIFVSNATFVSGFTNGAKTTAFVSAPNGSSVTVRFRITSKGNPARVEDRTIGLKVVSQ
jgi:hypothetical protein